ncbi:MAG: bifunctional phosphoglucose/phosphomannose isomerase [Candidatus Aenigmarchaeota archaeon]|nr:bifunctional phosphoglucose/phosphomannose isomerase [Candidatus Aenigmarchaeota archaeon]
MNEILKDYVRVCREAIEIAEDIKLDMPEPSHMVFTGMGGSGISGNLVKDIVKDDITQPIDVSKGYNLPGFAKEGSLVVCTSYSGNTEETLSQFVEALKRKCHIISIGSGGKLLEWSKRFGVPFIQVPSGYQPRESIPYLFFPLIMCMQKIFKVDFSRDIEEFLSVVPTINLADIDKIASAVKDTMPVIYGPSGFLGVMRRTKSELNENSKMHAKFEELPELSHNEVVGYELFEYPNLSVIFMRDHDELPVMSKRIEIVKDIIKGKVGSFHDIWAYGNSKLAKILSLVYQGDYLSFKLAELRNVDWKTTKTIDKVKESLKELGTVEKLEKELEFISS